MTFKQTNHARAKTRLKMFYLKVRALVGSILILGLAIAASALFFFAWLANEVLKGDTEAFDKIIRDFAQEFAGETVTALMNFVTVFGSTLFLSIVFLLILIIFTRQKWNRAAVLLTTTMAGAIILNFVLKVSFARARPLPFFETPLPDSYSFPSGHALFAACFYGALAWLLAARITNRGLQIGVCSAALLLILLIGFSRIYLGVHYPSDVIAGFAVAVIWVSAVILVDSLLENSSNPTKYKS
ncbi:MAG: phosphatase PAP2 family protein [Pyrinomonadaceae bacterium]